MFCTILQTLRSAEIAFTVEEDYQGRGSQAVS